jgi:hypothetical protein
MVRKTIFPQSSINLSTAALLSAILAGILVSHASAQTPSPAQSAPPAAKTPSASAPLRNLPPRIPNRAAAIYESVWGIADPAVRATESGVILRFNFRVVDATKAKVLMDKKFNPILECPDKGVQLVVPTMEKVGQLRQAPHDVVEGESYWMAFSNVGRLLKPGDHVDVIIGTFHARGLIVE